MDGNFYVFTAKVTAVYPATTYVVNDGVKTVLRDACTIDIVPMTSGRPNYINVPVLRANSGGKGSSGVWHLPEENDMVLCGFIDGMRMFPLCFGSLLNTFQQSGSGTANQKYDYVIEHTSGNYVRLRGNKTSGKIEVVHRSGSKIIIDESGDITIKGGKINILGGSQINLGENAIEKVIKGTSFQTLYNNHIHLTGVGPSDKPLVAMTDTLLSNLTKTV